MEYGVFLPFVFVFLWAFVFAFSPVFALEAVFAFGFSGARGWEIARVGYGERERAEVESRAKGKDSF